MFPPLETPEFLGLCLTFVDDEGFLRSVQGNFHLGFDNERLLRYLRKEYAKMAIPTAGHKETESEFLYRVRGLLPGNSDFNADRLRLTELADRKKEEKVPEMLTCAQCLGKGWYFSQTAGYGIHLVRCMCDAGKSFDPHTMRERISEALRRIGEPSEFPI
jgi:hypothetical protein